MREREVEGRAGFSEGKYSFEWRGNFLDKGYWTKFH